MKIAVLGTGSVGDTIGSRLVGLGHEVMMGSRSATNEKAAAWVARHGELARQGTFAEAAAFGELVFVCTKGEATLDALRAAGADHLAGKAVLDLTNALDFTHGFPPTLSTCNTDSLSEQIQREFPAALVVKTLNTMWAGLMVDPALVAGGDHTVFVSGNDAGAKDQARDLLRQFGWQPASILDLGDISTARGTEMLLPLWLRIYGATKSGAFNFRIVQ